MLLACFHAVSWHKQAANAGLLLATLQLRGQHTPALSAPLRSHLTGIDIDTSNW
jgi:hypothetical protein